MKIKKSTKLKNFFKRIFQIRWWLDLDRIRSGLNYLINGAKVLFIPQKNQIPTESFDAAVSRFQLSNQELQQKGKSLFHLSLLMCVLALAIGSYTVYQFLYGSYHSAFLSLVLALIALTLAFRYHFWYFQIKTQKLGCSISEWFQQGLLSRKDGKK
ncbi:MAG: type IV secretion protein IcmV [Legionella sp.]|nr:type IV secretion protein IcmV [Legionella sp.]